MRKTLITSALLVALAGLVSPSAGADASGARAVPECGNADLHATYGGAEGAAGSTYGHLRLRNVSGHTCVVQGFGGLSYVGHGDGTQIGAPAGRAGSHTPRIVLQPGDHASSLVRETNAQNYPQHRCHPTHVDGFRVYVPDSRAAQFVRHPTIGCANPHVHTLSHRSYR